MEKIINGIKGIMYSIILSRERIERNTLSQRDRQTMSMAIGEVIEDINKRETQNNGIQQLKEQLANLQDAFFSQEPAQILQLQKDISARLKPLEYEMNFQRLTADIFQTDSRIMTLQPVLHSVPKEKYIGTAYVTEVAKTTRKSFRGENPEEIIAAVREQQRKYPNNSLSNVKVIYIQKEGKGNSYLKYDIASGKDITPTYLQLPYMGKEEFKKTLTYLKENGAVYNANKKAWYVTPAQDFNKFKKYLPENYEKSVSADKSKNATSGSIVGQLNKNKTKAEEYNKQNAKDRRETEIVK